MSFWKTLSFITEIWADYIKSLIRSGHIIVRRVVWNQSEYYEEIRLCSLYSITLTVQQPILFNGFIKYPQQYNHRSMVNRFFQNNRWFLVCPDQSQKWVNQVWEYNATWSQCGKPAKVCYTPSYTYWRFPRCVSLKVNPWNCGNLKHYKMIYGLCGNDISQRLVN